MIQRIALFVASLAAVVVLVVGFTVAGFGGTSALATLAATSQDAAAPQVQVDTLYVAPPNVPATIVQHQTVSSTGGGDDGAAGGD